MVSINRPIRIGRVTVMPGDVVLARQEGVILVPPHLAEEVVVTSEVVALKDAFGHERLRAGVYTPGQIDEAEAKGILTADEADAVRRFDARVMELTGVDDFDPSEIACRATESASARERPRTKSAAKKTKKKAPAQTE